MLYSVTDAPSLADAEVLVFHGSQAEKTDLSQLPSQVSVHSPSPLVPHLPLAADSLQSPEPASDDVHSPREADDLHRPLSSPLSHR